MDSPAITFVPTPIGNRGDITLRALDVLRDADVIACEDTRHSRPLLAHYDIAKETISLHEHNEAKRAPDLVQRAQSGQSIAVISDAGMPGVSDPGYRLIQLCRAENVAYTVLPGPSAVLTALIGSGMPCHSFTFDGFLSVKKGKRRKALEAAIESGRTTLFFESPHRIVSTLEILADISPDLDTCVARELTKTYETYHRDTAAALHQHFTTHSAKGEIVLLINPNA